MAEVISNAKIFIDFSGATVGSAGSALLLQFVTQVKVNDQASTEVVKAIGKKRGAGFRDKAGGFSLNVTELRHTPRQIDWRKMKRDRTRFMLIAKDDDGGEREKWLPCRVSKVDRGLTDEGEHTDEIEVVCLDAV